MKLVTLFALSLTITCFGASSWADGVSKQLDASPRIFIAQAPPMGSEAKPRPKQGCKMIKVHCRCTNPTKDFFVDKQLVGRANPGAGDRGECLTKKDIDSTANKLPVAYCLSGQSYVKDTRKGESRCTATWTCQEACLIPPGLL